MPGMTGAELFASMRVALGAACPPVIFVSGTPLETLGEDVRRAASGFVAKPFHLSELHEAVRLALSVAQPDEK